MALLTNLTSTCVITHAKSIFARHGIPQIVVSDNGPCFNCKEWQKFAAQYDFKHITSSPHYAQSNGQAEKGVHILKQLLKKAADSDSDPYLALLSYRASPLQRGFSPAELLMKRKLRTTLPSHTSDKLKQKNPAKIEHNWQKQKMKQKSFYDRTTKHLSPLTSNNQVRVEDADGWSTKATVLQEVAPRSYTVKTDDGQILRRNRRSLLKTQQETGGEPSVTCGEPETIHTPVIGGDTDTHTPTPELRRSTREVRKPNRLNL
nr:Zgc:153522 [Danio rerio]